MDALEAVVEDFQVTDHTGICTAKLELFQMYKPEYAVFIAANYSHDGVVLLLTEVGAGVEVTCEALRHLYHFR
jgi:hypothetical protein